MLAVIDKKKKMRFNILAESITSAGVKSVVFLFSFLFYTKTLVHAFFQVELITATAFYIACQSTNKLQRVLD